MLQTNIMLMINKSMIYQMKFKNKMKKNLKQKLKKLKLMKIK